MIYLAVVNDIGKHYVIQMVTVNSSNLKIDKQLMDTWRPFFLDTMNCSYKPYDKEHWDILTVKRIVAKSTKHHLFIIDVKLT